MTQVVGRLITNAVISFLTTECPFPIGDGEAPSGVDGPIQVGLSFKSYAVIHRTGTWRDMGEDFTSQRASIQELLYQVVGVGLGREAAEGARDKVLSVMSDVNSANGEYLHPNFPAVTGHSINRRRQGDILTPQPAGLGTFNAPAYFLVIASVT